MNFIHHYLKTNHEVIDNQNEHQERNIKKN